MAAKSKVEVAAWAKEQLEASERDTIVELSVDGFDISGANSSGSSRRKSKGN